VLRRPILGLRRRLAGPLLEHGNLFGRAGALAIWLDCSCSEPGCPERAVLDAGWGRQLCERHFEELRARERAERALELRRAGLSWFEVAHLLHFADWKEAAQEARRGGPLWGEGTPPFSRPIPMRDDSRPAYVRGPQMAAARARADREARDENA
jgi:hypothetical protein